MSDRSQAQVATRPFEPSIRSGKKAALERARDVLEALRTAAPQIEANRALTPEVIAALHQTKLLRIALPRSLGGDEADLKTIAKVIETIAAVDASTAWCLGQGAGCAMAAAYLQPDIAREMFGPADAALAWGAGIAGKAVATDGGYFVTGKWMFASGCANATLLGGHCYVFERDGTPRKRADGRPLDRTALFDKSKALLHDNWHTMGLKGTASYTYEVDKLFVPSNHTIDREDTSELRESGTLYLFSTTHMHAVVFGALMLGVAQGMVDELTKVAITKTPRGAASSLRESPVFQSQYAVLHARLRAARAYLHNTLDDVWSTAETAREVRLDKRADLKLATTWVINQGVEVAIEAYRAAGQNAIFQSATFERRMRDALTASQQIQGRPSNYITIGRVLLGLDPDSIILG